jgi:hypothetical protein
MLELYKRSMQIQQKSALVWIAALAALTISVLSVWPSMKDSGSLEGFTTGMPTELTEALGMSDFATAAGYLNGNLYALLLPLCIGMLGLTTIITLTAGDEENGRLELLLALPISRKIVYLARLLSVFTVIIVTSTVLALIILSLASALDMELTTIGTIAVSTAIALLGLFHAAFAYAITSAGISKSSATAATAAVLIIGYIIHAIIPMSGASESISYISPWHWVLNNNPLVNGFDVAGTLSLTTVTLALSAIGTILIAHRDIKTA